MTPKYFLVLDLGSSFDCFFFFVQCSNFSLENIENAFFPCASTYEIRLLYLSRMKKVLNTLYVLNRIVWIELWRLRVILSIMLRSRSQRFPTHSQRDRHQDQEIYRLPLVRTWGISSQPPLFSERPRLGDLLQTLVSDLPEGGFDQIKLVRSNPHVTSIVQNVFSCSRVKLYIGPDSATVRPRRG